MNERSPSAAETIRRNTDTRILQVHSVVPARVVRWDATTQKADCKILLKAPFYDEEGARQVESVAVIPSVPVQFPGVGSFRLTFPISDGSLVIAGVNGGNPIPATIGSLFAAERSLDAWLSGKGDEVDPQIDHDHHLTDGIFMPGLLPFGAPLSSCPTDHATLGADGGVQIHLHGAIICIGDELGADFFALAQKVMDNFNALKTHFTALETVIGGPPIPEPGMGAPSAFQTALALALTTPPNPYPNPEAVATSQAKGK